jgi:hypothetical protein
MAHGLSECEIHRKRFCAECIPADVLRDAQNDRHYREGYRQAWREWSACVNPDGVSSADRAELERRRRMVEQR